MQMQMIQQTVLGALSVALSPDDGNGRVSVSGQKEYDKIYLVYGFYTFSILEVNAV